MSRTSISFDERDDEGKLVGSKELPMTLAILGNFSPVNAPKNGQSIDESLVITSRNFSLVFRQIAPAIEFEIENLLVNNDPCIVRLSFESMADFHPNNYLKKIPFLHDYQAFISRLMVAQGSMKIKIEHIFHESDLRFLRSLAGNDELTMADTVHAAQTIRYLALAQDMFNQQVNAIIYAPELQCLESVWLGVFRLVNFAASLTYTKILLLHAHKDALYDDLSNRNNVIESDLFYQICTKELDQFGGEPVSMLLNTFSAEADDTEILDALGQIGALAGCPVISGIDVNFFGVSSIAELENDFDFSAYKQEEAFSNLRKISKQQSARFLGFLMHRLRLREPYEPSDITVFSETYCDAPPSPTQMRGLWSTPVFVFPASFMVFYQEHGHCGSFESVHSYFALDRFSLQPNSVLDWMPTTAMQKKLADFGVMTFRYLDVGKTQIGLGDLAMFNINALDNVNSVDLVTTERINVYLPQLLFIAQLHHYLRLIQRQSFARDDHKALKKELLDWLKQYVSDAYTASNTIKLQRPLKSIDLRMQTKESSRDRLQFSLSITPHSPYRGLEYSVSL